MNSKNNMAEMNAMTGSEWYPVTENDLGMMFANPDSNPRYENLIGYFRGDFGTDGTSFYQTWFSIHPNKLYSDLEMMEYSLQAIFPMLKDFKTMCDFCSSNSHLRFPLSSHSDNIGFITGRGKLVLYVRLLPHMGDYNFYVYCYGEEITARIAVDLTFSNYPSLEEENKHKVSVCGFTTYEEVKARIPEIIKTECLRCDLSEGMYLLEVEFRNYNLCTKKDEYLDREEVYLLYENGAVSFLSDGDDGQ